MKVFCRERSSSVNFDYVPFEFHTEDVVEYADRSSSETDFTMIVLNDGTRHLIDMYYIDLRELLRVTEAVATNS